MGTNGRKRIIWKIIRDFHHGGWTIEGDIGIRHYDEINREQCKKLYTQEYRELNEFIQFVFS